MYLVPHVQAMMAPSSLLEKEVPFLFAMSVPDMASFQRGPLVVQPLQCEPSLRGEDNCVLGTCRRVRVSPEVPSCQVSVAGRFWFTLLEMVEQECKVRQSYVRTGWTRRGNPILLIGLNWIAKEHEGFTAAWVNF